ncbi:MAG: hypothetical protein JNM14_00450 [Ferruginibacter sp.]|nr:hypothetical protein [Ferruginibacter sp.]
MLVILTGNKEIMKLFCFLFSVTLFSCNFQAKKPELNPLKEIEPVNYSEIDNQVQNILEENNGKFPLIKFEKKKGNKHLIYFGEQHGNDPNDPRFDTIQKYFSLYKPAILLNEGGPVADSLHFTSRVDAIQKKGTIGFLKFLADNAKVKLQNADCPDSLEIASLLTKYNRNKVLYFLVLQRFVPQFTAGYDGAKKLETEYGKFTGKYLETRCNLKLTENEKQWGYFEKLYAENNADKKIDLENFDLSQTEFDKGDLGNISRSSLQIRDSVIIGNIYKTLQKHDIVFVVFGAAHLLAEKPTLEKLFE